MSELENYWNNKHPQQRIIYTGRSMSKACPACKGSTISEKLVLDVRTLIAAEDVMLQDLITKHKLKANSLDETMLRIQQFVVRHIKYVGDDTNQGVPEYWQFPFETIQTQIGDCEDGAILIASLALNAGIPAFRVRVSAGMVQAAPTAPEGGHGYCTYLRESDGNWTIIDWCYYENSKVTVPSKPIMRDDKRYKDVWFSFNHKFAFAHKSFEIASRVKGSAYEILTESPSEEATAT